MKSPETFDTAAVQYLKFRRRTRIAWGIFWTSYAAWVPVIFAVNFAVGSGGVRVGSTAYFTYALIDLVPPAVVVAGLVLRRRYRKLADEALPAIEAKTRVFQQFAVKSLAAFIDSGGGKSFKNACLKNLRIAASFIDDWSIGNLQFLEKQFGEKLKAFKEGFRFRLIPAIERAVAKSASTDGIYQWVVVSVQNDALGGFDGTRLEHWNNFLSTFEEIKSGGMWRWLASKTLMYNAAFLISVTVVVYAWFEFQRNILGADINTATNGINVVLTIFLAPYAVYLFTKYQGRKNPKTQ